MKRLLLTTICTLYLVACYAQQYEDKTALKYGKTITLEELKENLYTLAADDMEGRDTGESGQKKAAAFIKKYYQSNGIQSPLGGDDYFQEIPSSYLPKGIKDSENVVAFIKGREKPNEILVISAHYDHLGKRGDKVYNGADDNASGTAAVMEIAQAFALAKKAGHGPKRSILFLNVSAEEKGLYGSRWYVEHPIFPIGSHIADLNIDMIGRIDKEAHKDDKNYVYLIGSDKLSSDLHKWSEEVNKGTVNMDLDYRYNDPNDPNRFYYRSDHYNFAKHKIPVIFYFNGVHEDYHRYTDTAEKIDYALLTKRTKLVFYTAWRLANETHRPAVDSNKK